MAKKTNFTHLNELADKVTDEELKSQLYEFIYAAEEDYENIKSDLHDAEDEGTSFQDEIKSRDSEISELEEEIEELKAMDVILLAGGIIKVDVSELDYTTKESFKQWAMKHAITNSEPVFNL